MTTSSFSHAPARTSRAASQPAQRATRLRRRRWRPTSPSSYRSRWRRWVAGALIGFGVACTTAAADPAPGLPHVTETLVAPPNVPAFEPVDTDGSQVVQVRLQVEEKQVEIEPGERIWELTYNGSVPAPLIVVHQGDYLEVTLVNPPTNTLTHNIDFHAASGAMGGAELMNVAPGQQAVMRFKATKAGVFVYHCAPGGAMTPLHIAAGMSGAMMVLPREGLRDAGGHLITYDRAYYIGEQDFYVAKDATGHAKQYPMPAAAFGDMMQQLQTLTPTYVVYEGRVGALTGDHALTAKVGERVLFIHSQADRDTRVHIIGTQADYVWLGGSFANAPAVDYQTWSIPAGSAIAAICTFREPGMYDYMNHNMAEGMLLGANAQVKVEGAADPDLITPVSAPAPIAN